MKTRKLTIVIAGIMLVFFSTGQALAQKEATSYFSVSGTVKDVNTKRPVAFAHVFVPGTHVGTVANMEGAFTLKIQEALDAGNIGISHLGYKIAKFDIESRKGKVTDFLVEPHSVTLQEIMVKPHDPREIVLTALRKKEENYTTSPYLLTGFYRETIQQRSDYISIAEAVINIYQTPVDVDPRHNQVKIVQGRKSEDVKTADTLILKLQAGPNMSTVLDVVRNGDVIVDEETIDYYSYELLDIVKIEDEANYVIGFEPRVVVPYALTKGKFYISVESNAITMADFSLDLSDTDKAAKNFIKSKPRRLRFTPKNTRYLVTYTKVDGKYHLNYIRSEIEFFADWRRRLFRTSYTVMLEMAVTQRESENVTRFPYREIFSSRKVLADHVKSDFEEDFWGEYNYIEPDQSIETAIRKLYKTMKLSKKEAEDLIYSVNKVD